MDKSVYQDIGINMNIKEMTIEQLKALKCDHYENIARSQQTLALINAELESRVKTEEAKKAEFKEA